MASRDGGGASRGETPRAKAGRGTSSKGNMTPSRSSAGNGGFCKVKGTSLDDKSVLSPAFSPSVPSGPKMTTVAARPAHAQRPAPPPRAIGQRYEEPAREPTSELARDVVRSGRVENVGREEEPPPSPPLVRVRVSFRPGASPGELGALAPAPVFTSPTETAATSPQMTTVVPVRNPGQKRESPSLFWGLSCLSPGEKAAKGKVHAATFWDATFFNTQYIARHMMSHQASGAAGHGSGSSSASGGGGGDSDVSKSRSDGAGDATLTFSRASVGASGMGSYAGAGAGETLDGGPAASGGSAAASSGLPVRGGEALRTRSSSLRASKRRLTNVSVEDGAWADLFDLNHYNGYAHCACAQSARFAGTMYAYSARSLCLSHLKTNSSPICSALPLVLACQKKVRTVQAADGRGGGSGARRRRQWSRQRGWREKRGPPRHL